jgi:hypothetical protein
VGIQARVLEVVGQMREVSGVFSQGKTLSELEEISAKSTSYPRVDGDGEMVHDETLLLQRPANAHAPKGSIPPRRQSP